MTSTGTRTTTYTVADIRKVVENFAADYSMIAQSTGLRTREQVAAAVSDLNTLARYDYLVSVTIYLLDKAGGMERQLFTTLKADGRLLEQERISLSYAKQKLQTALNPELEQTVVSP